MSTPPNSRYFIGRINTYICTFEGLGVPFPPPAASRPR
ncbi:hypothetical protein [Caudoviricetes sp.]|nr:hypothetical protein [Caudoviricetes sp.]UOF81883.1 hypothetical protein [Caudoviricetes sp.]